ncbi:MAG: methylthioribulose 1-phosphate dehydratase [Thermoanaerobaculia bacterium]
MSTETRERTSRRLCRTVSEIHGHGWCLGTSGNFSVTLGRRPLEILITRSGRDKRRLTPADLVTVDGDGRPVDDDEARPSAETLLHCILARHGAGSTLHTHSVAGTLLGRHFVADGGFTLEGYEMLKGLAGVETHAARIFVPVVANTQDMQHLGSQVAELLADRPTLHGFLIAGHGLYTWGDSLTTAQRHVEIFEFLLECVARRTGFDPPGP